MFPKQLAADELRLSSEGSRRWAGEHDDVIRVLICTSHTNDNVWQETDYLPIWQGTV